MLTPGDSPGSNGSVGHCFEKNSLGSDHLKNSGQLEKQPFKIALSDKLRRENMNSEKILEVIITKIKDVKPELENAAMRSDDNLADLGANSVERSEIIIMTMEALDLRIPLVETYGPTNIGELAQLFSEKMACNSEG